MKKILKWVGIVIASLLLLVLVFTPAVALHSMLDYHVDFQRFWAAEDYGLKADTLHLKTADDFTVEAYQICPTEPKAVIICISGIQNPSVSAYMGHAKMFYDKGYASILMEMRGHGASSGDRICLAYNESEDVRAVTDYIKSQSQYKDIPVVIMGMSMGAAVAINSMAINDDIDILVSLSSFSSCENTLCEMADAQIGYSGACSVFRPFIMLTCAIKYGVNPFVTRPLSSIKHLNGRPALLMHSQGDTQVFFSNFEAIMKNEPSTVETFVQKGDEHFISLDFTHPLNDTLYSKTLLDFLDRNIK
ncbi:MAG: alpha/beta hydrolase [Flavobacteriales bacterium]|nr:alpha/beta hydrolase [Flavobacteriales bacterium]